MIVERTSFVLKLAESRHCHSQSWRSRAGPRVRRLTAGGEWIRNFSSAPDRQRFRGLRSDWGRSTVGRRYHPSGRRPRKPIERRRSLRSATHRRDEGAHALAMARYRGTEISNPFPSSGESANFRSLTLARLRALEGNGFEPSVPRRTRSAVTLRRGLMSDFRRRKAHATCSGKIARGGTRGNGEQTPGGRPPSAWQGRSPAFPVIFAAAFFELCPQCRKPVLEDIDDRVADLGRRKGGSVYETTPTIDF